MMRNLFSTFILSLFVFSCCFAQYDPNYNENKVPDFKIPNPLKSFNGKKIKNVKKWEKTRRPELLDFFTQNIYGEVPGELELESFELVEQGSNTMNGKAKRKQN